MRQQMPPGRAPSLQLPMFIFAQLRRMQKINKARFLSHLGYLRSTGRLNIYIVTAAWITTCPERHRTIDVYVTYWQDRCRPLVVTRIPGYVCNAKASRFSEIRMPRGAARVNLRSHFIASIV